MSSVSRSNSNTPTPPNNTPENTESTKKGETLKVQRIAPRIRSKSDGRIGVKPSLKELMDRIDGIHIDRVPESYDMKVAFKKVIGPSPEPKPTPKKDD